MILSLFNETMTITLTANVTTTNNKNSMKKGRRRRKWREAVERGGNSEISLNKKLLHILCPALSNLCG